MSEPVFTSLSSARIATILKSARSRICLVAPGIQDEVAAANASTPSWQKEAEAKRQIGDLKDWIKQSERLRNVITASSIRWVKRIASEEDKHIMDREDLVQEGLKGLAMALERYGWRQTSFENFAYRYIQTSIQKATDEFGHIVKLPAHLQETAAKLLRLIRQLEKERGNKVTASDIAKEIDVNEDRVKQVMQYIDWEGAESLPNSRAIDHKDGVICQTIQESPAEASNTRDIKELALEAVSTLTEREREVLTLRFGLDGGRSVSLDEVARKLETTRERVRQIEAKALRKLRHPTRMGILGELGSFD